MPVPSSHSDCCAETSSGITLISFPSPPVIPSLKAFNLGPCFSVWQCKAGAYSCLCVYGVRAVVVVMVVYIVVGEIGGGGGMEWKLHSLCVVLCF